jgi:hypothetical protein
MKGKKSLLKSTTLIKPHPHAIWGRARNEDAILARWPRNYIIPMVARTLEITERLQEGAPLTVDDIQRLTGYSRSTIYRILRTLAAFGYVDRAMNRGEYRWNGFFSPQ